MINNIDLDIVVYSVGSACDGEIFTYKGEDFSSKKELNEIVKDDGGDSNCITVRYEPEQWDSVKSSVVSFVERIIGAYDCDYQGHISGKSNFRYDVATICPYKGNRKSSKKPHYYDDIRQFLVDVYESKVSEGCEADDAIGLNHDVKEDVISTLDKDLNCIPGVHYNWTGDGKEIFVSEVEANQNFYSQVLTGDSTDNILGLYGVGKNSKMLKDLKGLSSNEEMFELVRVQYQNRFGAHWKMFMLENCRLLWILQRRDPVYEKLMANL